jgi:hypothetical protein
MIKSKTINDLTNDKGKEEGLKKKMNFLPCIADQYLGLRHLNFPNTVCKFEVSKIFAG